MVNPNTKQRSSQLTNELLSRPRSRLPVRDQLPGPERGRAAGAWMPSMAEDIDALAAAAYAHGQDAIDVAVERVAEMIEVRGTVMKSREESPGTFPVFGSTDTTAIGRRVVASLLNAGWRPPTDEDVVDAADRSRQAS